MSAARVILFGDLDAPMETGAPRPERVTAGAPVFQSQTAYQSADESISAGVWSCGLGAWSVSYDEFEYCHILSGRGALVRADGLRTEIGPGDAFIIEPGFEGVWEVSEPLSKQFVIVAPKPAVEG